MWLYLFTTFILTYSKLGVTPQNSTYASKTTSGQQENACRNALRVFVTFRSLGEHAGQPLYADLQLDVPDAQHLVLREADQLTTRPVKLNLDHRSHVTTKNLKARGKIKVACGLYFLDSTLPLFDSLADRKYLLPERSSDEECIKHHLSTLTVGCKIYWVKKNFFKKHA